VTLRRRLAPTATGDTGQMTLTAHLYELRSRMLRAALAIVAGMILAFVFYDPVSRFLTHPYCTLDIAHHGIDQKTCSLITIGVFDPLTVRLKIAMIVGIVCSAPFWLYQLWAFIAPGLHRHERRWGLAFAACSAGLFAAGAAMAYLTLSKALAFLLSFAGQLTPLIAIDKYLSFVTTMIFIFGVSFEFPLLVVMLNFAGILKAEKLAASWRMIVFLIFVFAAFATPSQDPFSMLGMAVPMTALYGVAFLVARTHDRRLARREAASPYAALPDDAPSELGPADPLELDSDGHNTDGDADPRP